MIALRFCTLALASLLAACAAGPAPVTETRRDALVERIVKAQRLQEQFDQQLAQQRDIMRDYAAKLRAQAVADGGGQLTADQEAVLHRFMDRSAAMFSGKELADRWASDYGKDLSIEDLQQITAYYESPLGQRDVVASKTTLVSWSDWMNREAQTRSSALVQELTTELDKLQP